VFLGRQQILVVGRSQLLPLAGRDILVVPRVHTEVNTRAFLCGLKSALKELVLAVFAGGVAAVAFNNTFLAILAQGIMGTGTVLGSGV